KRLGTIFAPMSGRGAVGSARVLGT
ncbi:MAG: hypothetical protein RLZ87_471, partial [Armatimonadota bacterium]